jgi:glycosyltransferase involved in cell wall biosynthesis
MSEADSIVVLDTGSDDGTYEYLLEKKQDYP